MHIKGKNELKNRIDIFLHDFTSEEYKINEEYCKETMRLMADFISHVDSRLNTYEKKRISNTRIIKELKEKASDGCTGICRAKISREDDTWYIGEIITSGDKVFMLKDDKYEAIGGNASFKNFVEVDPETVQRYTGKEDSEGNKLFEGDIMSSEYSKTVKMEICYGRYGAYCPNDCQYMENIGFFVVSNTTDDAMPIGPTENYAHLLGNVIDNPDLAVV